MEIYEAPYETVQQNSSIDYDAVINHLLERSSCKCFRLNLLMEREYFDPVPYINLISIDGMAVKATINGKAICFPKIGTFFNNFRNESNLQNWHTIVFSQKYYWPDKKTAYFIQDKFKCLTSFFSQALCQELFNAVKTNGIMLDYNQRYIKKEQWFLKKNETLEEILVEMDLTNKGNA